MSKQMLLICGPQEAYLIPKTQGNPRVASWDPDSPRNHQCFVGHCCFFFHLQQPPLQLIPRALSLLPHLLLSSKALPLHLGGGGGNESHGAHDLHCHKGPRTPSVRRCPGRPSSSLYFRGWQCHSCHLPPSVLQNQLENQKLCPLKNHLGVREQTKQQKSQPCQVHLDRRRHSYTLCAEMATLPISLFVGRPHVAPPSSGQDAMQIPSP